MVIQETTRLYPPGPIISRESLQVLKALASTSLCPLCIETPVFGVRMHSSLILRGLLMVSLVLVLFHSLMSHLELELRGALASTSPCLCSRLFFHSFSQGFVSLFPRITSIHLTLYSCWNLNLESTLLSERSDLFLLFFFPLRTRFLNAEVIFLYF
ncbi:hypothetical protein DsansV1_C04g0043041 [Dioscorea sansibarensis]